MNDFNTFHAEVFNRKEIFVSYLHSNSELSPPDRENIQLKLLSDYREDLLSLIMS
jgi:hypothetical protein